MATKAQLQLLKAANAIIAASAKPKAKRKTLRKNPAPRIGTAKPKRRSQATGKPPTKRLIARRKSNAKKGYFPNPAEIRSAHKGTGTAGDVLPFAVLNDNDKPIAYFSKDKDAIQFAKDYTKRHNVTTKVVKL